MERISTQSFATRHPLAKSLCDKGWSITNAAKYLGVTRQHLYNIIKRPPKGVLWDCAAAGLPACSTNFGDVASVAQAPSPPSIEPRL
ncbi:MAG: helix-turn-helix domain-containing protein [Azonexus sp.]